MNSLASHALGYIGRIADRDKEWIEEEGKEGNYRGTDHIGKSGLEQHYEFELHGQTGYEEVEIDAGGRALRSLKRTPVSGNDLIPDSDSKLQEIAEKAFPVTVVARWLPSSLQRGGFGFGFHADLRSQPVCRWDYSRKLERIE